MPDGQLTLDGQILELARGPNGQGWAWEHHSIAAVPGVASAEDRQYNRAPESNFRTTAWTDWSGGIGAAKHMPGEHRLHYSESPTVEMPGRIVRGHAIRTVAPANAGTTAVSDFFEINSRLYVVIGATVRRITVTLNAETVAARATDGVGSGDATGVYISTLVFTQASPIWYDGTGSRGFLGTDNGANFIVRFDGTSTWAQDDSESIAFWALGNYGDGVRLWGASPTTGDSNGTYVRNLAVGADPFTAASWSSRFAFSQRQDKITALAALRDNLVVGVQDGGVYALPYLAGGIIVPLTDIKGQIPHADSGRNMRVWGGVLFVPLARGLFAYIEEGAAAGRFEAVGMESLYGHEMPIRGMCTALFAGDPAGLWAAFYDAAANTSHVLRGRWTQQGEPTRARFIWNTMGIGLIGSLKVTALHISHIGTNPVLCIGTDVPDVRFVTLPRAMRNVLDDANCLVGDVQVSSPTGTTKVFARWYEGKIVSITTARGYELSGTPNHPILSGRGWVPLESVVEGNYVVSRSTRQEVITADHNTDYMDVPICEIFNLLRTTSTVVQCAGTEQQFHGDGKNTNVYVVSTDGLLKNGIQATVMKPVRNDLLTSPYKQSTLLAGQCSSMKTFDGLLSSTQRYISRLSESTAFASGGSTHPSEHFLRSSAGTETSFTEMVINTCTADVERVSNTTTALSLDVSLDKVVSVRTRDFHGYVYNLETYGGWYIGNSIIAHNCRSQTTSRSTYLPDVDGGAPTTLKRFWRVRFKTVGFTADEYANVFVRADRGTYRQVGIIDRVPVDDVPLPKGTEGVSLGVRMDWVGTVNTVFPQIEGVETDYTETPLPAEWIDVVVYAARGQHQRTGTSLLSQSDILHLVRGLQGQVREVDCVGPEEETYVVKVDSATDVVATPVEEIPGRGPGWHIRFRLNVYNALLDQADMIWDSSQWSSLSAQSHWQ